MLRDLLGAWNEWRGVVTVPTSTHPPISDREYARLRRGGYSPRQVLELERDARVTWIAPDFSAFDITEVEV